MRRAGPCIAPYQIETMRRGETKAGKGETMLLERERERLLEILESRTASHGEIQRAREMLEESRSPAGAPGENPTRVRSEQNGTSSPEPSDHQPRRGATTPRVRVRKFWT